MKIQEAQANFKRFRCKSWKKDKYLYFNDNNVLVNQDNRPAYLGRSSFDNEWEEYDDFADYSISTDIISKRIIIKCKSENAYRFAVKALQEITNEMP